MRKNKLLIVTVILTVLCGCGQTPEAVPTIEETSVAEETVLESREVSLSGVIVALDTELYMISIYNIANRETIELVYNGATDIQNKYGDIRAMNQMQVGDMVDGVYESSTMKLKSLKGAEEAWVYTKVTGFDMDRTNLFMEFSGGKYKYDSSITIVSEGKLVEPSEVNAVDELTIWGIGTQIYSIQITRGHGYISLKNEEAFLDGIVMVNNDIAYKVTSHMLMVVPEGQGSLEITKGNASGKVPITVIRNEETTVDVQGFQEEAKKIGSINFMISPSGADLFINGKQTSYNELVELPYGSYRIKVEADGYTSYESEILVGETFQRREIKLEAQGSETEESSTLGTVIATTAETESTSQVTESSSNPSSENSKEESTETDKSTEYETESQSPRIHVTQPAGAEVYLDGEYMGNAPLAFPKVTGEHTITLKQAGYVNKTYTVDIAEGKADAYYSFAQLEVQ